MRYIVCVLIVTLLWSVDVFAEQLSLPLDGPVRITCHFCGYRYKTGACHGGIDFDTTDTVTPIYAAADGVVEKVDKRWHGYEACLNGVQTSYGNTIVMRHADNSTTRYAHLLFGSIPVAVGDHVTTGQQIAIGDSTGCVTGSHLHFEVRDAHGNAVDPYDDPADQQRCIPHDTNIPQTCGPNSLWVTCPPVRHQQCVPETCNNLDDDCDSATDEDWPLLGQACEVCTDECVASATWVCEPGHRGIVCDTNAPVAESERCDGVDNDCDGVTDNGVNLCGDGNVCVNGACRPSCDPPGPSCNVQGTCSAAVYDQSRDLVISLFGRSEECSNGQMNNTTYFEYGYHIPDWAQCSGTSVRWREFLHRSNVDPSFSGEFVFEAGILGGRLCGTASGDAAFFGRSCVNMSGNVFENGHACP